MLSADALSCEPKDAAHAVLAPKPWPRAQDRAACAAASDAAPSARFDFDKPVFVAIVCRLTDTVSHPLSAASRSRYRCRRARSSSTPSNSASRSRDRPTVRRQAALDRAAHRQRLDARRVVHAGRPREPHRHVLQRLLHLRRRAGDLSAAARPRRRVRVGPGKAAVGRVRGVQGSGREISSCCPGRECGESRPPDWTPARTDRASAQPVLLDTSCVR
jgi:hypothetical protein